MKLYEPVKIKNVNFKSRITFPPMVPFGIKEGEDYALGEEVLTYYEERIHGNLGLLVTQCFSVVSQDVGLRAFGLDKPRQREDLGKLIELCHKNDTKIIVQLAYTKKDDSGRRWTVIHNGTIFDYPPLYKYMKLQKG